MLPYQTLSRSDDGIAIVGIGGAGANVLQCFGASSAEHVRLYTMSLDERVGQACGNVEFIQLGEVISRGLGSGGDPEVGRRAMEESEARVRELLEGCKLLVMVVGLGGGTGSGAAPVLARIARESGLFLVSVVVMPFGFEGKRRREQADAAHEEIARLSDIVYCFENDYMEELFRNRSGARAVFEEVDRLLAKATASVPMIATSPGLINLGLDELATALENHDSRCIFGSGSGYGPNRAKQAAQAAINSPLASYHGALRFARAVIVHIAGGESLSLAEIRHAMDEIHSALGSDEVDIYFGATVRANLGEELRITLITSIDAEEFRNALLHPPAPAYPEEPEQPEPDTPQEQPAPDTTEEPADEPAAADEPPADDAAPEPAAPEPEPEEEQEPEDDAEEAPEDEPAEEPAPAPAPAPRRAPAPRPAPQPEPPAAAEPPAPKPKPQQLDLFSGSAEPPTERYNGTRNYPFERDGAYPGDSALTPEADMETDDWDIPPSKRRSILNDIFPDDH